MSVGLLLISFVLLTDVGSAADDPSALVVLIDWKRFDPPAREPDDTRQTVRMLLNAMRNNLAWAAGEHTESPEGDRYVIEGRGELDIRRPASAAFGISAGLVTGIYDEETVGVPEPEARQRVIKLIKGVASTHRANGDAEKGWGDVWQSALWATQVGHAGWLMWDHLDAETRRMVSRLVVFEADRFIRPGYQVPYWNGKGGDTKAEENAWNATIHQLAVAMMPEHPHAPRWKRIGSELMVSAFALERDVTSNTTVLDGRPVKEWIKGYNVRDDGAVINHNLIHCDYMTCISLNLRAFLTLSLAGRPVPETASFNADVVYRCLATHDWPSPPYEPPGGTMYVPGKADLYYPMGTDWSRVRFGVYHRADTYADLFGWDEGWPHRAAEWKRIRAERILTMQARHPDGRTFAKGEFDTYRGVEQIQCGLYADSFLLHWLRDRNAISKTANWNAP